MPLWVGKFLFDTVETGLGVLFAIEFVVPSTLADSKAVALLIAAALAGAVISAARRAVPAFLAWLKERLGTTSAR